MYACSNLYGGVGVSKVCRAAHTDSLATHDLGVVGVERTVSHAQTRSNDILRILFLITEVHGKVCIVH